MIYKYTSDSFFREIKLFFHDAETVLDIGCGVRPCLDIIPKTHICLDPSKEYMDILKSCHPKNTQYIFLNTDALTGLKTFADLSVDTVLALDLIEHLKKEDGFELLKEADRVAKKQIIFFTPLGFVSNEQTDSNTDAWGLHGKELQKHRSGWLPEDFGDAYDFHICETLYKKETHTAKVDKDFGAFYAIKNKFYKETSPLPETPLFVKEAAQKQEPNFYDKILQSKEAQIKHQNELLKNQNEQIKNQSEQIKILNEQIKNQNEQLEKINLSLAIIRKHPYFKLRRLAKKYIIRPIKSLINDEVKTVSNSAFFNKKWYLEEYDDVRKASMDPAKHYVKFGWKEGRNPGPDFNGEDYLDKRPDVREEEMCPLYHYEKFGKYEI